MSAAAKTFALALGLIGPLATLSAAPRWKIQYLYDQPGSNFNIRDIACPSVQRCVAAGVITDKRERQQGAVVVTSDSGRHWSQYDVKEQPLSLFFLDETLGWMVTDHGLWSTVEGGRSWNKVDIRKGILQVCFLDANHGYITGSAGLFAETLDGGKTWTQRPETGSGASSGATDARSIVYGSMTFLGPHGIIVGEIDPSAPVLKSANAADSQGHVVVLETQDGGKKWTTGSIHLEAGVGRLRISKLGFALTLIVYNETHGQLASAVFESILGKPKTRMIFGERDRTVTDVALLDDGGAIVVAVEPTGNAPQVPIPGKLKILESSNRKVWEEMDVDYRAVAQEAVVAVADKRHIWVATDTGAILGLLDGD
ncbi:MAG TPA: YCF48-related protein [Bryobacteraceae bacterium]|nr:YCF48-related protein [Bryobacteraceae bacterium]